MADFSWSCQSHLLWGVFKVNPLRENRAKKSINIDKRPPPVAPRKRSTLRVMKSRQRDLLLLLPKGCFLLNMFAPTITF